MGLWGRATPLFPRWGQRVQPPQVIKRVQLSSCFYGLWLTGVRQSEHQTRGSHCPEEPAHLLAVLFALLGFTPQLFQHNALLTPGARGCEVKRWDALYLLLHQQLVTCAFNHMNVFYLNPPGLPIFTWLHICQLFRWGPHFLLGCSNWYHRTANVKHNWGIQPEWMTKIEFVKKKMWSLFLCLTQAMLLRELLACYLRNQVRNQRFPPALNISWDHYWTTEKHLCDTLIPFSSR